MGKYIYIVYTVSTSESTYSQTSSCGSYYFNANSFKWSMTLSYSVLHGGLPDSFDILTKFARLTYRVLARLSY